MQPQQNGQMPLFINITQEQTKLCNQLAEAEERPSFLGLGVSAQAGPRCCHCGVACGDGRSVGIVVLIPELTRSRWPSGDSSISHEQGILKKPAPDNHLLFS